MASSEANGYRELTPEAKERSERAHWLLDRLERKGVYFRTVAGKVRYHPASLVSEADRAELAHLRDEAYELLRDEEEEEARLMSQPEMDPLPDDEWEAYEQLGLDEQMALCDWIAETLEVDPKPRPLCRYDSYYLKHVFERAPGGFYTTDEQFRCAMWLSGFLGRRYPGRYFEDLHTRFYHIRPNREGLIQKLLKHAGVPAEWARAAFAGNGDVAGDGCNNSRL